MIVFEFKLTNHYKEFHDEKHSYIYEYEGYFKILINGREFFNEPGIAIYEFFRDVLGWIKNKSKSMLYNCIETEDNPLISFIQKDGGWSVYSPWQKYKADTLFEREELETAIKKLESNVKRQLASWNA